MKESFYIEVNCQQKNHVNERICGDTFLSGRVKEENRTVVVLSDGMGHGVKASLLSTLTATMALNFTKEHKDVYKIAEIIMNTLPVCSERKISYSTFSIVDIDSDGNASILEYDNPECVVLRGDEVYHPQWQCLIMGGDKNAGKEIKSCVFRVQKEDRIVLMSDGVAQAGLGKGVYLFGWGKDNVQEFVLQAVKEKPEISADRLAAKVVNKAHAIDAYQAKDDISCAVIYFREPRQLLVCTGPPFEKEKDRDLSERVKKFKGRKILCGGTTADIIGHYLHIPIQDTLEFDDPDLPPVSFMEGIDLVTEGILTLSKVSQLLERYDTRTELGKGPADLIVKHFLESDKIDFVVGTAINIAHQDPTLPVELEIRRSVVKKIVEILEEKFLKEVTLQYI